MKIVKLIGSLQIAIAAVPAITANKIEPGHNSLGGTIR